MNKETRVQTLDEGVCISNSANTIRKGIQIFSFQLWVNSRTGCALQHRCSHQSRRRKSLDLEQLNSAQRCSPVRAEPFGKYIRGRTHTYTHIIYIYIWGARASVFVCLCVFVYTEWPWKTDSWQKAFAAANTSKIITMCAVCYEFKICTLSLLSYLYFEGFFPLNSETQSFFVLKL